MITSRQITAARLRAKGLGFKQIAFDLGISKDRARILVLKFVSQNLESRKEEVEPWINLTHPEFVLRFLEEWA